MISKMGYLSLQGRKNIDRQPHSVRKNIDFRNCLQRLQLFQPCYHFPLSNKNLKPTSKLSINEINDQFQKESKVILEIRFFNKRNHSASVWKWALLCREKHAKFWLEVTRDRGHISAVKAWLSSIQCLQKKPNLCIRPLTYTAATPESYEILMERVTLRIKRSGSCVSTESMSFRWNTLFNKTLIW